MKYVPGRKSDVQDCQWLQKLMSLGFLRAAFRPVDEVCVVRAVARQRDVLLSEQASWVRSSTLARFWPTGLGWISRASTAWGWLRC
jgi:hypothetical protein